MWNESGASDGMEGGRRRERENEMTQARRACECTFVICQLCVHMCAHVCAHDSPVTVRVENKEFKLDSSLIQPVVEKKTVTGTCVGR